MLGGIMHEPAIVLMCAVLSAVSGLHWILQEGTRRNWPFRYSRPLPWFTKPPIPGKAPPFKRWMTDDDLLVGYQDAWIRLPWVAIRKAIVSQHAVELKLTSDGIESWYLERANHGEDEWRSVRDHVLARVSNKEVWGSARN